MKVGIVDVLVHRMCRNDGFVAFEFANDATALVVNKLPVQHGVSNCRYPARERVVLPKRYPLLPSVVSDRDIEQYAHENSDGVIVVIKLQIELQLPPNLFCSF